jgi:EF-hand domain pair
MSNFTPFSAIFLGFLAMASSSLAFSPLATTKQPQLSSYSRTTIRINAATMSVSDLPSSLFFADEKEPASPSLATTLQSKSKPKPKQQQQQQQQQHKEGIFSPVVLLAKEILGDKELNKLRADAISLHADVIGSFVATSETTVGNAVLRRLFELADKDKSGTIEQAELALAVQTLGFGWLQEKQISGIFARADTDKNGAIDMDEWMKEAPKTLRTNLVKLAKKNGGDLGFLA